MSKISQKTTFHVEPQKLKTKIFLDSGDSNETKEAIKLLGFLDGQTTNPTLIAKNPEAQKRLAEGKKFTKDDALDLYKQTVKNISTLIPSGSVSVEVYADKRTTADEMIKQGREMFSWIPNAHIKFPATKEGLKAANLAIKDGLRVNMTLVFTQEQAAAVYGATLGARKGQTFLSPFVGRLDDRGEKGVDLIANILRMYKDGDGHVEVLAASVRNMDHFTEAVRLGSDIITAPLKAIKEWHEKGVSLISKTFHDDNNNLKPIVYKNLDLSKDWQNIDFSDELIDRGVERFANDWNTMIE